MTQAAASRWSRWWPWLGGLAGVAALAWVLRRLDLERFRADLAGADVRFILLVPLAIVAEQWVRAWKWRQLLHPLKRGIDTLRIARRARGVGKRLAP
ncbi:MAG: hypothetical protein HYY28_16320 [Betaproteobacteria bacterium]|nr:hypothetical protein [Betaproteobacteria bacterium]